MTVKKQKSKNYREYENLKPKKAYNRVRIKMPQIRTETGQNSTILSEEWDYISHV